MGQILLGIFAGIGLAAIYFGGLWMTVKKVAEDGKASKLVLSFFVRAAVVLVGFYWLLQVDLMALGAALVTFVVSRLAVTRIMAPETPS